MTILKDVPRDEHGNIRLAEIPLADMLKQHVLQELASLGLKMTIIGKDIATSCDAIPDLL